MCRFRPMNRLEVEQRSEECIDINDDSTTVFMKNAGSLGKQRYAWAAYSS